MLQLRSARHPFVTTRLAFKAARVLAVAESMGLWSVDEPVVELDASTFRAAIEAAARAGVASKASFEFGQEMDASLEELERFLDRVYGDLHGSPVPECELPVLERLFGVDDLADLLSVGASTLRRYLRQERDVPEAVADRIHFLALVLSDLAGSYNERGLRRWFDRARPQLAEKTPRMLLQGDWSPNDANPQLIAALASELSGAAFSSTNA